VTLHVCVSLGLCPSGCVSLGRFDPVRRCYTAPRTVTRRGALLWESPLGPHSTGDVVPVGWVLGLPTSLPASGLGSFVESLLGGQLNHGMRGTP
jgi:hypothetical protein